MLKREHTPVILYLLFCFFLRENLSYATIVLALVGAATIFLKIRLSKTLRTVFALSIFASYWVIYGKMIDPEVGLNFLTSVIMLKMLEKDGQRDDYMIFFGLILLLSAGSLFEKNLTYVTFYGVGFLSLVFHFYSQLKIKWRVKELMVSLLWVMPLTAGLFFFAPRLLSPLPFNQKGPAEGRVGYTPDLNISELESLSANDAPVFQALVPKVISSGDLYWRGNVLAFNDGWNWTTQRERPGFSLGEISKNQKGIKQEIRLLNRDDYFFALDRPSVFSVEGRVTNMMGQTLTLGQNSYAWVSQYEVFSDLKSESTFTDNSRNNLRVALSQDDKAWIHQNFKGQNFAEVTAEVKRYFDQHKFSYSYAPGRVASFRQFMLQNRIGLCSHYASALGIILRVKGIPTRLVSGFLGGSYNPFASFYLITQNDAHTWVESLENGQWKRIDPTVWIAPERVTLGGEAFVQSMSGAKGPLAAMGLKFNFGWLQEMKLWFNQWDYRFYRWLDQMDYHGQVAILTRLKLKRQWLYLIIPTVILLFSLIYMWQMSLGLTKHQGSELERLWNQFIKKTRARGLALEFTSLQTIENSLINLEHKDQKKLLTIFQNLVHLSFGEAEDLKQAIKKELKTL